MRMYDIIEKKKRGGILCREEIAWMVQGFVRGNIPDYQMSAMLMAIYFQGMEDGEITDLTLEMAHSGDMVDLSPIQGVKVDKHSTGGVGDKTTLIAGPLAAACGVKVAKMSGRGLGHTGGTVDKLESIPGFRTEIPREEFFRIVNEHGIAVIGQSGNLVPADKKLYALRDVTATVDSIPLIASSIMSKKLAAGSDGIVLDVKTGSGAFMKDLASSRRLAEKMVAIGRQAGKRCCALITNMDVPLGRAVGNALEMREAIETLMGRGTEDLVQVSTELAALMVWIGSEPGGCSGKAQRTEGWADVRGSEAGKGIGFSQAEEAGLARARERVAEALKTGAGLRVLADMAEAQGGDPRCVWEPERLHVGDKRLEVKAQSDGYLGHMDTEAVGIASVLLGAGRSRKEDALDYGAGIMLHKKYGDPVRAGETIGVLYASREELLEPAAKKFLSACAIEKERPEPEPLIYEMVRG